MSRLNGVLTWLRTEQYDNGNVKNIVLKAPFTADLIQALNFQKKLTVLKGQDPTYISVWVTGGNLNANTAKITFYSPYAPEITLGADDRAQVIAWIQSNINNTYTALK